MEGDALDHAGDFLGRRSALWNCDGHEWVFILPGRGGAGVICQEEVRFHGIWRPDRVRVGPGVSQAKAGFVFPLAEKSLTEGF
jgi:hypothetical protein